MANLYEYPGKGILNAEGVVQTRMVNAHHPFMVIVEALKRAGANPTPEDFVPQGLETIKDFSGEGIGPAITFTPNRRYSAESCFLGKVNMSTKNYDRITDWISPPQDLIQRLLK